ncbi:glycosyltransferase [Alteromonas sp. H39]|uniref:glycosyltransferase n=1 Tax=Alteromonas sp. H39 TaxID=3389876 RepID=UPI0039E18AF5
MKPEISVVMACYNEPVAWLTEAIHSILNQTFKELELLVVVDNPNHQDAITRVTEMAESDNRLRVLVNEKNMGLPRSLNRGFSEAKGALFARMDADDIADKDRFLRQADYLTQNPEIDLIGTAIENIDARGEHVGIKTFLTSPEAIEKAIKYRSVACHPTWLMRRHVYESINGYRYFPSSEDYDFLYRVLDAGFRIANLEAVLLKYRLHDNSMTSALSAFQYQVKGYIQTLHRQRVQTGEDNYSPEVALNLKKETATNAKSSYLVTKAREAEEGRKMVRLAFWGSLAVLFSGSGMARVKSFLGFRYVKWRYER